MKQPKKQLDTVKKQKTLKWFFLFFVPVLILIPLSAWAETTGSMFAGILFWIVFIPSIGWFLFCMVMAVMNLKNYWKGLNEIERK